MQTWINNFVSSIRPSNAALDDATRCSNYMIEKLEGIVEQQEGLEVVRVMIGGSNATHTTIKNHKKKDFDVDVHVYLEGENVEEVKLRPFLRRKLIDIYPNKNSDDFETKRSCVKVKFKSGTQLNVDVVPVIHDTSQQGWWGYIPQPQGNKLVTNVPEHIEYVRNKTRDSLAPVKFNRMVRLMKWWNRFQETKASSFAITCLTGESFSNNIFSSNWLEALSQAFDSFRTWRTVQNLGYAARIGDPINSENNAAYNWSTDDLDEFKQISTNSLLHLQSAKEAYDTNNKNLALKYLQEIFGSEFKVK